MGKLGSGLVMGGVRGDFGGGWVVLLWLVLLFCRGGEFSFETWVGLPLYRAVGPGWSLAEGDAG